MADVLTIPGLNGSISGESFELATNLHNQYSQDSPLPKVDIKSPGFQELCAIIVKYHLQSYLRIRLLHRHFEVKKGYVMLGAVQSEYPSCIWTTPTSVVDIDPENIHGHTFSLMSRFDSQHRGSDIRKNFVLIPSEFRQGPSDLPKIDSSFVTDLIDCLSRHNLERVLGIESREVQPRQMTEFSNDAGSLLVDDPTRFGIDKVKTEKELETTSWGIDLENNDHIIKHEIVCILNREDRTHDRYTFPDPKPTPKS